MALFKNIINLNQVIKYLDIDNRNNVIINFYSIFYHLIIKH